MACTVRSGVQVTCPKAALVISGGIEPSGPFSDTEVTTVTPPIQFHYKEIAWLRAAHVAHGPDTRKSLISAPQ
jgi:hypothetical protein